jgi:hypothetical protein
VFSVSDKRPLRLAKGGNYRGEQAFVNQRMRRFDKPDEQGKILAFFDELHTITYEQIKSFLLPNL